MAVEFAESIVVLGKPAGVVDVIEPAGSETVALNFARSALQLAMPIVSFPVALFVIVAVAVQLDCGRFPALTVTCAE